MFEVWGSQIDPGLWIVLPEGGKIPANESQTDWTLMGRCRVSPAVDAEVRQNGYATHRASRPFDAEAILQKD